MFSVKYICYYHCHQCSCEYFLGKQIINEEGRTVSVRTNTVERPYALWTRLLLAVISNVVVVGRFAL